MKFTLYETATGQVLYGGDADSPEVLVQPGQALLLDHAHEAGWIANGQHHSVPAQPSQHHAWDWATRQWYDPRTLQDHKQARNAYINAARLQANRSFFTFQGKQIAVDALSRSDIDAMHGQILFSGALPSPWIQGWKAIDNSYVSIPDLAAWGEFYKAMVDQGTVNFNHAQALKVQLNNATTPQEVALVVW